MNATLQLLERLGAINSRAGRVNVFFASCFIGVMTLIVITGVFFRYVLNDSIAWVEDVSLILMVTTAFLVAPFAYRTGANVAIELVIDTLPATVARTLRIVINLLVLWIIYRYFFESLKLVERGWGIRINTVPLPWAIPYLIVPVAFLQMALVAFELIGRDVWGMMNGSADADLPHVTPREPE